MLRCDGFVYLVTEMETNVKILCVLVSASVMLFSVRFPMKSLTLTLTLLLYFFEQIRTLRHWKGLWIILQQEPTMNEWIYFSFGEEGIECEETGEVLNLQLAKLTNRLNFGECFTWYITMQLNGSTVLQCYIIFHLICCKLSWQIRRWKLVLLISLALTEWTACQWTNDFSPG